MWFVGICTGCRETQILVKLMMSSTILHLQHMKYFLGNS